MRRRHDHRQGDPGGSRIDSYRDTGSGDTITVSPDGNSWSDTGMNWSGPDVYLDGGAAGYWTTPAVSDYG